MPPHLRFRSPRLRASRQASASQAGTTWHLDEVLLTLLTEHYLLQRAGDQHVAEVDILLQKRRDTAAARRFFKRVLAFCPKWPSKNLDRPTPSVANRPDLRFGQRQRRLRQTS